jgi:hypothetical protein
MADLRESCLDRDSLKVSGDLPDPPRSHSAAASESPIRLPLPRLTIKVQNRG